MTRAEKVFRQVRSYVGRRFPEVRGFRLYYGCPECDELHARRSRAYMHVLHYPSVVCTAKAASRLPLENLWGLFLHEFGHIIGGPTQRDADWAIWTNFGIPILYGDDDIQFVRLTR